MLILLFLAIFTMYLGVAPRQQGIVRVRRKTAREEALHDQIQAAMNWRPEMFHQREDGRWFNSYGQEGVCLSLNQLFEKHKTE